MGRPLISLFTVAVLLVFANTAFGQPASQTPPTWVMSKDPVINGTGSLDGAFLGVFGGGTASYNSYDRFIQDEPQFWLNAPTGYSDNSLNTVGAVLRNYEVRGLDPLLDVRKLRAQLDPGSDKFNCRDFTSRLGTNTLTIVNANFLVSGLKTQNTPYCGDRKSWVDYLIVRDSVSLINGHLTSEYIAELSFGTEAVKFDVEGDNNFYLFKTVPFGTNDIDLEIKPNSRFVIGDKYHKSDLGSSPTVSTNSSLKMGRGSRLQIVNATVSLVGDYQGRAGYDESVIEGASIDLDTLGNEDAQLNLSVANVLDSFFVLKSRSSALRATRLAFTGTNFLSGYGDASIAAQNTLTDTAVMDSLSVDAGKTTLTCPEPSCNYAQRRFQDIYTRRLDVASGGMLDLFPGVNFDHESLELVKVNGQLITRGELSPNADVNEQRVALAQFDVGASGVWGLHGDHTDLWLKASALISIAGEINFNTPNSPARAKILSLLPQGELSSRWGGADVRVRINPTGWPNGPLTNYSDYISVRQSAANAYHVFSNLQDGAITLESATPGLTARDFVDGGFDDPVYGKGAYNVLVTSNENGDGWPRVIGGDRFGTVHLGTSMPAGLVARVTRGLNDSEIDVAPPLPSLSRIIQIQLSESSGPFSLNLPDVLTNENSAVTMTPTLVNQASGTVDCQFIDITPADGGAAYAGSYSVNGVDIILTPASGDGATCTDSLGTGGRTFTIQVVAGRSGLPDPDAASLATATLTVCSAGSSISPYISYPNILDAENAPVGSAISKSPTVYGFTPNSYSVVSGSLPSGLTLNSSTGVISGTPSEAANGADAAFTIQATDGSTTVSDPVTLVIDPIVSYRSDASEIGMPFTSAAPTVSAYKIGSEVGNFTLTSQPAGTWAIDASGVISGTPEVFGDNVFKVTYKVGPNGDQNLIMATFHLTVDGDPIALTYSPGQYEPGQSVSLLPSITNDRDAVTYSVAPNSLPTGWSIDSSTGEITGIMPQGFEPSVLVTATDSYTSGSATAKATLPPPVSQVVTGGPGGLSATLTASGCTSIASASFVAPPASSSKPTDYIFPFDLLDFELTGCSTLQNGVGVEIQYSQPFAAGTKRLFKEERGVYSLYGSSIGVDTVKYVLTDNGSGDDDNTVGIIRDPAGVGIYVVPPVVSVPIPIPIWSLWLLIISLLGLGAAMTRRHAITG